jgi:S1-C subfamily serine protease
MHLARPGWMLLLPVLLLALWASWVAWPGWHGGKAAPPVLTIEQIDAALRDSFAKQPLRSAAALAYEAIIPSVVRVVAEHDPPAGTSTGPSANQSTGAAPGKAGNNGPGGRAGKADAAAPRPPAAASAAKGEREAEDGRSVGTGVVIVDKGIILTNMHVIAGASRIRLTFWDGSESLASVMNLLPEQDLAVLQAHTIPDDLHAATMRSTADLQPGDEVLAVGFPFGIGPSASTGVVSGLKREFRSSEGRRTLSNLIQFDAAANPGNSGGPLVTMDGHLVGIVTAIMNPNAQRTFIGIGFAVPIENAATGAGLAPF